MNKKRVISIVSLFVLAFNVISVQAKTISSNENYNKIDHIAEMKAKVNKKNNGIIVSDTEKYFEFTQYKDNKGDVKTEVKEYDKNGYSNRIKSEAIYDALTDMTSSSTLSSVTPGPTRSWLRTSLQVTSYGTGTGYVDVDGFFEWLKKPLFTMTDAVALAHDSNTAFPVENLFCEVGFPQETVGGTRVDPDKYISQTYRSSGYQSDGVSGAGFTFSLKGSEASLNYFPYGYIHAKAIKTTVGTVASTVSFSYGHSEYGVNVSPKITFPGGSSIVITPQSQVDSVSFSTVAKGF